MEPTMDGDESQVHVEDVMWMWMDDGGAVGGWGSGRPEASGRHGASRGLFLCRQRRRTASETGSQSCVGNAATTQGPLSNS